MIGSLILLFWCCLGTGYLTIRTAHPDWSANRSFVLTFIALLTIVLVGRGAEDVVRFIINLVIGS